MNKFIGIGYLGNDPDIVESGCKIRLAINGRDDNTIWLSVFLFGTNAENTIKYKKKGDKVAIEGRIEQSKATGNLVIVASNIDFL